MLPYDTYPAVIKAITAISEGKTETRACLDAGLSVRVLRATIDKNDQLRDLYNEAQVLGYDRMAEILLEIDRDPHYGQADPKMAKVISDNIKWLLEKRKPKEYGVRVQHDVNLTADHAVIEALARGRARAQGEIIDTNFTEVKEIAPTPLDEEAIFLMSIGATVSP